MISVTLLIIYRKVIVVDKNKFSFKVYKYSILYFIYSHPNNKVDILKTTTNESVGTALVLMYLLKSIHLEIPLNSLAGARSPRKGAKVAPNLPAEQWQKATIGPS
jgi:hypothetical protein